MIRQTDRVSRRLLLPRTRSRHLVVASAVMSVGATLLVGCGLNDSSSEQMTPLPTSPTTTVATTSAPSAASTTSSPSSSTTSTSSSVPGPTDLRLWSGGLGDVRFGVDPEGVISFIKKRLGPPDEDSGYVDSYSEFGSCPGTRVRGVRWGDLLLLFGDESTVADGRLHFYSWKYGPATGATIDPPGLKTDAGIGLGSTVADLRRLYPSVQVFSDEIFGAGFEIERTLSGTLSSIQASGTVTVIYGGITCGE